MKLNKWFGLFLLLVGCNSTSSDIKQNYIESNPTFFELRNEDWLTNDWIRNPDNLMIVHETFKKMGYMNLIQHHHLFETPLLIQDIYINRKGLDLLDSLEITFIQPSIDDKYYREFWQRRVVEKNDTIVYTIISEINSAVKNKIQEGRDSSIVNQTWVNDTLATLLEIEFRTDNLTEKLAQKDIESLIKLGFHQSAYNLLFENSKYQSLKWNKDSLVKSLKYSPVFITPWFQANTK
jgi:hypothetical protein